MDTSREPLLISLCLAPFPSPSRIPSSHPSGLSMVQRPPAVPEITGVGETEESHDLTGYSFTGLEVRCQREGNSSICDGEGRKGLSTRTATLQIGVE